MFAKLVSAAWGDDTDQVVAAGDATDQVGSCVTLRQVPLCRLTC